MTLTVLSNDHVDTDPEEVLSNKIYSQVCSTLLEKKDSMGHKPWVYPKHVTQNKHELETWL